MVSAFCVGALVALAGVANAQNITQTGSVEFQPTPVSTSVPSATGSLDVPVPGQGSYPPLQSEPPGELLVSRNDAAVLCNAGSPDTFCPGSVRQLLKTPQELTVSCCKTSSSLASSPTARYARSWFSDMPKLTADLCRQGEALEAIVGRILTPSPRTGP